MSSPHWQCRDAALAVDRAVDRFADREILGERAGERPDARVAPILPRLDRQDLDLQDVAGLGIRDRDRAGQDMGAELWGQRLEDRAMIGEDLETRAGRPKLGPARNDIEADGVPR